MSHPTRPVSAALSLCFFLVACGGGGGGGSGGAAVTPPPPPPAPAPEPAPTERALPSPVEAFMGTWQTECTATGTATSTQFKYTFTQVDAVTADYTYVQEKFGNTTCEGTRTWYVQSTGQATWQADTQPAGDLTASKVKFGMRNVTGGPGISIGGTNGVTLPAAKQILAIDGGDTLLFGDLHALDADGYPTALSGAGYFKQ